MAQSFIPTHRITTPSGRVIAVMLVSGAGYTRSEWESETAADYERDDSGNWTFQGEPFSGSVILATDDNAPEYQIAYLKESGEWDVVKRVQADDEEDVNAYAEREYGGEWYVLDSSGRNINGG